MSMFILKALLPLLATPILAQYTATYSPGSLPQTSEQGQYGTNQCGTASSATSKCQNVFVNGVDDFCLWGPPSTHSEEGDGSSKIGNVEQIVVSYCLKDGYGTRLIPSGTITGAHFVKVQSDKVSYVQVTGQGDLTKLLIPAGDEGGELDVSGFSWTGLGNPQGGLVFTNAFSGQYEQTHEWTSFMSSNEFCIRACQDGPNAAAYCQHIYDVLSCQFTIPGNMGQGFDSCLGDPTEEAPGVYGGSTFHQDEPTTPAPHPAGATRQCQTYQTVGGGSAGVIAAVTNTVTSGSSAANITGTTHNGTATSTASSVTTSIKSAASSVVTSGSAHVSSTQASASASTTSAKNSNSKVEKVLDSGLVLVGVAMGLAMIF
nr:hypothetical protein L204_00872 [Cryptococcus depauperatus CBS 7855]